MKYKKLRENNIKKENGLALLMRCFANKKLMSSGWIG